MQSAWGGAKAYQWRVEYLRLEYAIFFLIVVVRGFLHSAFAQTANDNMEAAEYLQINQSVNSSTHKNTIQPSCVDESLPGQCIKYHNDQWFTFNTGDFTQLFINISNQKCRDLLGVQLIVIEGEPCTPETYKILDCVSLATQDDVFVSLKGLRKNNKYWLNIDGYLHDFCSFQLEVSDKPAGFSANQFNMLKKSAGFATSNVVTLHWNIPDSLSHKLKGSHIMKRNAKAFRFEPSATIPINYNAYGKMQTEYQYTDTLLHPGKYYYRLIIESNESIKYFTKEFSYEISPSLLERKNNTISVKLDYRKDTPITVLVVDAKTSKVLDTMDFYFEKRAYGNIIFYTNQYLNSGTEMLEIQVINKDNNHKKVHYYNLRRPSYLGK